MITAPLVASMDMHSRRVDPPHVQSNMSRHHIRHPSIRVFLSRSKMEEGSWEKGSCHSMQVLLYSDPLSDNNRTICLKRWWR